MLTLLLLFAGLAVLSVGAELLVRGASALAAAVRISPLVIGLTVIAYGTSTPELLVSVQAAVRGSADVSLGNVVGSNVFNILFILGLSALITPLVVAQRLVRIDVPLMIALSGLLLALGLDGALGRIDGLLLLGGLAVYTIWSIRSTRKESEAVQEEYAQEFGRAAGRVSAGAVAINAILAAVGLGLLVLGARWFVYAAVAIARSLDVSELVIGLTIVAAGTSLPEVATSIMAAMRRERDIAVGNAVGSNIFNILGVLGISSLLAADGVAVPHAALRLDIPVMIVAAVACLPIFFTGHLIARWEGGLFFAYYLAYVGWLVLSATGAAFAQTFAAAMLLFVGPLTVITLVIGVLRSLRKQ